MAEVNTTEALATTRQIMDEELQKSFEQEAALRNLFKKVRVKRTNQKGLAVAVYTSPNPSINYRDEGAELPAGGTHKAKQWRVFYARPAIGRRTTGDVYDLSSQDSIINWYTDTLQMDYLTWEKDQNRELFGDGTGAKAFVSSGAGSATITMTSPLGVLFLLDGAQYQFFNPTTGAERTGAGTVYTLLSDGALNKSAMTATFTTSVSGSVQAGDAVAYKNSYLMSVTGLEQLVSDATTDLQGVSRGTVPSTKSPNLNASSKRLSLTLIDQQELQVSIRMGSTKLNGRRMIVCHESQIQAYRDTGRNYQRWQSGGSYDGGMGGLNNQTANGYMLYPDVDCKFNDWWHLNLDAFAMVIFKPLGRLNKDGLERRMVPTANETFKDSYLEWAECKYEYLITMPQSCSRMYNLDTTGLVSPHFG